MSLLTVHKNEARAASPAALLDRTFDLHHFAGVPTLVLDSGVLPDDPVLLGSHVGALIEERAQDSDSYKNLTQAFQIAHAPIAEKITLDRRHTGHVTPYALRVGSVNTGLFADATGPEAYVPLLAAIVIAPDADFQPQHLLHYAGISAPLDTGLHDNTAWRYWITHHELAHVAGADEPQADLIASLLTRRAFPDDPAVQMMADMRALINARDATLLHANPDNNDLHDNLESYGWCMVEAIDSVLALPQEEIDAMSDAAIIAHRFDRPDRDTTRLLKLGEIFTKVTGELDCRTQDANGQSVIEKKRCVLFAQGHIDLMAQAANFMEDKTGNYSDDPAIAAMAARTALAARRLERLFDPGMPA